MSATAFPGRLTRPERGAIDRRLRSFARGDVADPAWVRPALIGLLTLTAVSYLIDLTSSGYANSFYAAAVQAGTKSWKTFFFGSLDSSSFITVDKPPASLWVMALSGRIFGFSSASMLIPQVIEGLIAVGLLFAAVKRWFGASAGLLAGAMLAITPVAALMFRFNNPDSLLVCLLVASAYCLVRAVEKASTRWLLAVGTLLGFAFLTKMLQAFLVLPGFALVYFVCAPTTTLRRVRQLALGGVAVVLSCGWWLAAVALWPTASRPMIDGSPDNNIFNLIFGYNGLGRIFGSGSGNGGGGGNFSGSTGPLRLFNTLMGGQASWLLPAALITLVAGLWWIRRAPRTDHARAGLMLWGSWLLMTALVFSFGSGTIHTYYTVALAPAIAALAGIGAVMAWRRRDELAVRITLAVTVLITAGWAIVMLERTSSWEPWLVPVVAISGVAAAAWIMVPWVHHASRIAATLACVACLAAPLAFTVDTLSTAHTGSVPSAGPSTGASAFGGGVPGGTTGGFGGGTAKLTSASGASGSFAGPSGSTSGSKAFAGGGSFGGATGGAGGGATTSAKLVKALEADASKYRWVAAVGGSGTAASLELASGGDPVMAIGGFNNEGGHLSLAQFKKYVAAGDIHYYIASSGGAGGAGGFTRGATTTSGKSGVSLLFGSGSKSGSTTALATGSRSAPPTGSKSGFPGGSSKSGAPTGAAGQTGGAPSGASAGGFDGGSSGYSDSAITKWVEAHFTKETIGGQTVYNLTNPK